MHLSDPNVILQGRIGEYAMGFPCSERTLLRYVAFRRAGLSHKLALRWSR